MKKLLFFLAACSSPELTNRAEVIAKSKAPEAKCRPISTTKIPEVAICVMPDETEVIAIYSDNHPFQAFVFKTWDKVKTERSSPPPAEAPPDAGTK